MIGSIIVGAAIGSTAFLVLDPKQAWGVFWIATGGSTFISVILTTIYWMENRSSFRNGGN